MKGIVLAGGSGTRLYPITKAISKQLIPIYDKPMIYHPISVLIKARIKDILIISTNEDILGFKRLLGDGSSLGITFSYEIQPKPEGLAQAFIIGKNFIGSDPVCMVLGDNIFHGHGLENLLKQARYHVEKFSKASVFATPVKDPERYGVVEFDKLGNAISIEEKPIKPKSDYAVAGLYFYPNSILKIVNKIRPSKRGELEITAVNQEFLKISKLMVNIMDSGYAWFDTGTHDSLSEASDFVKVLEKRQGLKIGCIEEEALKQGFISPIEAKKLGNELSKTEYGKYIQKRAREWK
jgi:glucose-1-phosphate thymidylyltransferase